VLLSVVKGHVDVSAHAAVVQTGSDLGSTVDMVSESVQVVL
jgi:hypothetical protein